MSENGTAETSGLARRDWPHWLVIAAMFVASALIYPGAPDRIPTHWNIRGEVDGHGGRIEGLFLVPVIALGMYALLVVLPRLDPGRANYASFSGPYAVIRLALTATMAGVHALILATVLGYAVDAGRWMPLGIGLLFVVLGNVMGKVRPNYFVGIRTPWTLASARSWEQTHRVGGRLFVISGAALMLAALIDVPAAFIAVGVFGAGSLLWTVYLSYRVWRDDPERVPVTGTRPAPEDR